MAELVAEHLAFGYDGLPLIRDVQLTLRSGEMVICLGANGSGKTTLLRLLSGLLSPQNGRAFIRGTENDSVRNQVGILFQNPDHQMLAATIEEEIALGLELRGIPPSKIRAVVDSSLERFALPSFRHRPPQALSGGQKQRVALAAILVTQPPFLLFDEPDSYLDAPSRREFLSAVSDLRGECGILWTVPHARNLPAADRYAFLTDGVLHEMPREELLAISEQMTSV